MGCGSVLLHFVLHRYGCRFRRTMPENRIGARFTQYCLPVRGSAHDTSARQYREDILSIDLSVGCCTRDARRETFSAEWRPRVPIA